MTRRLIFCLLCAALGGSAQTTTAELFGTVSDVTSRPLAGAHVVVDDASRGVRREAATGSNGLYRITGLAPGTYKVTANTAKFQAAAVTDVRMTVDSHTRQDFTLSLEGTASSITVTAPLGRLDAASPALGFTLDRERIASLPLNRRDFLQLSFLLPGVLPPTQDSELSTGGSFAIHASGAREEFNNFTLDGVDNNDPYINRYVLQPSVDSIQEFKVLTNNYSAEYGRSAGAQLNVVTRGGTNALHGSAYEFLRNRKLDARNFFEGAEDVKYIRNQFGGSVGGPIRKDRAFFFTNYETLRERRGLARLFVVPGAAERSGDLSGLGKTIIDPFTQRPFAGNVIPADRVNPLARRILQLYPAHSAVLEPVQREDMHNLVSRVDTNLTNRDTLTLRYGWTQQDIVEPFSEESTGVPNFGNLVFNNGHNVTAQHQRVWSASTIQLTRFAFTRSFRQSQPQNSGTNVGQLWGVNWLNVQPRDYGYPSIKVAGYAQVGDVDQLPLGRSTDTYQVHEQFSLVRGRHSAKVGGEIRRTAMDGYLDYFTRGSLTFSGALTGTGIGDLLLGLPSFAIKSEADNRQSLRSTAYNLFVHDDWRVTHKLSLSLGVRYEYNTPPIDPQDRMYAFDPATLKLVQVGTNGIPRAGIRNDGNNFAPRLGFAYSPTERWVVRGGYGVFYDSGKLVVNSSYYFNPPLFNVRVWFPTAQSLLTLSNPFPSNGGIVPPASVNTLSPDVTTGYLQQWNFAVERQISRSTTATLAYAGSKGTHLIRSRDLNQAPPGTGNVQSRRPVPAYGGIFYSESGANSNFHSLQAHIDRRMSRRFGLIGSYTWSKSIDDTSAFLGTKADKNFPQNSANFGLERSLSAFDMRHRVSAAATYQLLGFEARVIGTVQSGQPFTPLLRFDNSNTGNSGGIFGNDRPNVLRDPRLDSRSADRWFDTSAFVIPAPYTFGNAGRNILTGAGLVNFDVGFSRRFALGDRFALTADAQAFNLTNTAHFDLPERYVDEPTTFGRILSAKAPRQIQLSLRLSF